MSRMSHAKYRDEIEPLSAFDVDDNYDSYSAEDRKQFRCLFCNSQIQFSRGKSHDDPHFKNVSVNYSTYRFQDFTMR